MTIEDLVPDAVYRLGPRMNFRHLRLHPVVYIGHGVFCTGDIVRCMVLLINDDQSYGDELLVKPESLIPYDDALF